VRKSVSKKVQTGFTLIEMVVVIVILGILAAVAIPRFIDQAKNARISAIHGLAGSMTSAMTNAHAQYLIDSNNVATSVAAATSVSLDGASVGMANGYPTATGISSALPVTGFAADTTTAAPSAVFTVTNAPTTATACSVTYTPAAAAGATATVVIADAAC
jgi:MSHA pilin protein MshA